MGLETGIIMAGILSLGLLGWDAYRRKLVIDRERMDHLVRYEKEFQSAVTTIKEIDAALDLRIKRLEAGKLAEVTARRQGVPMG